MTGSRAASIRGAATSIRPGSPGFQRCWNDSLQSRLLHPGPDLGAQRVDGGQALVGLEVPVGPAVAGRGRLDQGADLVDRAGEVARHQAAVGAHAGLAFALGAVELVAGRQQAGLDQGAERHARLGLLGAGDFQVARGDGDDLADPVLGQRDVLLVLLQADVATTQALGGRAGGASAEERIEDDVAGLSRGQDHPVQQGFRLLGRMNLGAVLVLQALIAGAQREGPVRAHLDVVVGHLHGVVVEGVAARAAALGGPDQGLVGVGEPGALEVRHRVGLAPYDVVQEPEANVLQLRADAEDIVIAADHPERAVVLEHAAALGQPLA
uniref:LigA n=1 Tax=Parastrongyloides trichosuri TaxID=131310 RepID=A0A0N4ZGX3_PARTI